MPAPAAPAAQRPRPSVGQILSMPPQWLAMYDDFITKNAGQVSQIESALRSLTYIIPGTLIPSVSFFFPPNKKHKRQAC